MNEGTTNGIGAELPHEEIFAAHEGGKLTAAVTAPLDSARDLSIAYTSGVAQVSRAIASDPSLTEATDRSR
ncbi:hypothetical protein [Streptomyces antimycoticus]|uniref:hypothetical protein n=1 Tax=Streptomyces antimycoticus TaxID=68175 RepID=UPI00191BA329|nr:hypothetical protein [Streptomyces antimycoticus]